MCKICSKDDVLSVLFSNIYYCIYYFSNIYYCVFFSVMTTFCFVGEFFMFLALKIPKCLYNSTMLEEQFFFISFIKCIVNCARSYRWRRLRALYLNSALMWRKARALWKYNELVLTNHGARISLNILTFNFLSEVVLVWTWINVVACY